MQEDPFEYMKKEEIPKEFYSDLENAPFCSCTFCNKDLLSGSELYMIEKSYKINPVNDKRNTIFEYAICASCSFRKMQAMSEESVQNIQAYMQKKFVIDDWDSSRKLHFERCVVTGKPISELEEYNMIGQFIGNEMIVGQFPVVMSPSIGEELQELLSQQTKDEFDDFMSTINNVPPELKELFKSKRPVLV